MHHDINKLSLKFTVYRFTVCVRWGGGGRGGYTTSELQAKKDYKITCNTSGWLDGLQCA